MGLEYLFHLFPVAALSRDVICYRIYSLKAYQIFEKLKLARFSPLFADVHHVCECNMCSDSDESSTVYGLSDMIYQHFSILSNILTYPNFVQYHHGQLHVREQS